MESASTHRKCGWIASRAAGTSWAIAAASYFSSSAPTHVRDDARLEYLLARVPPWVRVAVEFRHPSWHDDGVFDILERHRAAYCVMSGAGLPCVLRATTDLVYVRLHGPDTDHLYGGSYSDDDLRWWADRIREWRSAGQDVYAYFNNDGDGNAVRNAETLRWHLGQ